ncbi:hypothetical protein L207DRAFT_629360 [Hyaloscypha variabilis F]|uniref:Uncharacterized protein n=1 Tax=Hyaloscypha variabilis (strain UAMH 11265 / GT02V1 / F) TaxID=1149755 RepID=A0A2J6S824_HYAVF|nr:hypothetical protein L207DRAFT_629360 [Hyaloscypha variabilis F]
MSHDVPDMSSKDRSGILDDLYTQLKDIDCIDFLGQTLNLDTQNYQYRVPPNTQKLHILDLPDEILMNIFGHLKAFNGQRNKAFFRFSHIQSASDIKTLRLTYRRFCTASSHLLLNSVYLEPNQSSLSRLENISRHAVGKGVRGVLLLFRFYDSFLAQDFFAFAEHSLEQLRETNDTTERAADHSDCMEYYQMGKQEVFRIIQSARRILAAWEGIINGTPDNPADQEDMRYRNVLRRTHVEYARRFSDQQKLLENEGFVRATAVAFARMPIATRL